MRNGEVGCAGVTRFWEAGRLIYHKGFFLLDGLDERYMCLLPGDT